MGHIHEQHGRISIETRRESFIIHAGYGYKQAVRPIGSLKPGDEFDHAAQRWTVHALFVNRAEAWSSDQRLEDFSLDLPVGIDGEDFDGSDPLAEVWRLSHPEFKNEDLDDLIAALTNVRNIRNEALMKGTI